MFRLDFDTKARELTVSSESQDKGWVALLTGTDPQYQYDRDFIAFQNPTDQLAEGTETLSVGDVIERADTPDDRTYYVCRGADGLDQIDSDEVDDAIGAATA